MSLHNQKAPVRYSLELAKEICREIATSTKGVTALCKENQNWPRSKTIHEWRIDHPEFAAMFFHAKLAQADLYAEEILEIADDSSRDTYINKKGEEVCDNEYVNRSRLRVDSRKWYVSKLIPKTYGDKIEDETTRKLDQISEQLRKMSELNEKCKMKEY